MSGGNIDPRMPYRCPLPSGRAIEIFFYDGPLSHDVAFGDLLKDGKRFAEKILGAFSGKGESSQIVHIVTDGETYGHHNRFGDMALAFFLHHIESNQAALITIYGEYLEKTLPRQEVEILENSSWSCVHGVERWRKDCGCNTGMHAGWNQEWRTPLRRAMDWLRDRLIPLYEREMKALVDDPWKVRDEYIQVVLNRSKENVENFLSTHALRAFPG